MISAGQSVEVADKEEEQLAAGVVSQRPFIAGRIETAKVGCFLHGYHRSAPGGQNTAWVPAFGGPVFSRGRTGSHGG